MTQLTQIGEIIVAVFTIVLLIVAAKKGWLVSSVSLINTLIKTCMMVIGLSCVLFGLYKFPPASKYFKEPIDKVLVKVQKAGLIVAGILV